MTREEAIKYFKRHLDLYCVDGISREAEEMAIQALSQEPTVTSTDEPMTMVYPTIVCDDAISRKEALKCINDTWGDYFILNELFERINKLPSVTQKSGKWIPVSERLPEEFADVFCSTDAEEVFIATYLGKMNDGVNCFDDDNGMMCEGDVIAWMPLPKPYEPQESEDE